MAKNCEDCGYCKTYINRKKMDELNTTDIIFLNVCDNINMPATIEDLTIAESCKHYDDDSWLK